MKKVFEKLKKYEGLIIITLAILVICLISYIVLNEVFLKGNSYEDDKLINSKQYFETPDRIVYKEKGEDKYYVFTSQDEEYQEIRLQQRGAPAHCHRSQYRHCQFRPLRPCRVYRQRPCATARHSTEHPCAGFRQGGKV